MKQTAPFHTVGFRWPSTREFPPNVRKLTVQEFVSAIELAAHTVESMKEKSSAAEFKDLLQKEMEKHEEKLQTSLELSKAEKQSMQEYFESEKRMLEEKYTRTSSLFQKQIDELNTALSTSRLAYEGLRGQMEELKKTSSSFFGEAIQKATEAKDQAHAKEMDRIERLHRESRESFERQSKELLVQIESRYKEEEQKIKSQLEQLQKKESDSSVMIGQRGEQAFEDIVAEHTKWNIQNTSKQSHATDRFCILRDCHILFEIKNYSSDVPSEELKKFYRDMEEHNDHHLGVFISMKTGIQTRKQKGYIQIEWTKNSQMLLIFQHFYDHNPKDILSFIDACADTALAMYRAHSETVNSTSINYQKRIDQVKLYIEKELKRVGDILKQMRVDKQNLLDMIERNYTNYKYNLDQNMAAMRGTLDILVNSLESQPPSEENTVELPPVEETPEQLQEVSPAPPIEEKKSKRGGRSKKTTT